MPASTHLESIAILKTEERDKPKPHTVYQISVTDLHKRTWQLWKRYSDFTSFHSDLTAECHNEPPLPLPPKSHSFFSWKSTSNNPELVAERKVALERYLRSMLASKDAKWRESTAWNTFLNIPLTRATPTAGFTVASWLEEQSNLLDQTRSVRALLSKRDALVRQGDTTAAHTTSVEAKKSLATLVGGITKLAASLDNLAKQGMAEGELRRRSDMVTRLQDELETCAKLANGFKSVAARSNSTPVQASSVDRQALLGDNKPKGRVLGKQKSLETEQTRPLDNHGLLQLQQQTIDDQDDRLSSITAVIRRQRDLGTAIYNELEQQNVLLDELSEDVDRTGRKLGKAGDQLKRL